MEFVNAIARARFNGAHPQCVKLQSNSQLVSELLCLEPGQTLDVGSGAWTYYVLTGTASLGGSSDQPHNLPAGQLAAVEDEPHRLANAGDRRLVCLAVGHAR